MEYYSGRLLLRGGSLEADEVGNLGKGGNVEVLGYICMVAWRFVRSICESRRSSAPAKLNTVRLGAVGPVALCGRLLGMRLR